MPGELLYLDSSALVKLVLPEAETPALLRLLASWPQRVASALSIVEVLRSARRVSGEEAVLERARQVLDGVHCIAIDASLVRHAGLLEPVTMRSLDAIHLASALALGADLGAAAIYDHRLAAAARAMGVSVLAPR